MKIFNEKISVISDLHIGSHCDSPVWHKTTLDFAYWLKDTLLQHNIKDIVILGDVFNNRNEISVITLNIIPKFFNILKDFNIIITVGNHDCYYNNRSDVHSVGSLAGWENITVIEKSTTVTLFNKIITFCPWETKIKDIPQSDIILGHFEIESFKMSNRQICNSGWKTQDVLNKSKLIISGHFHIMEARKYKEGEILYIGCPYELNWNDYLSPKGIYILDLITNEYKFIENLISPKHYKIRLTEILALGKITDNIKQEFKNNIINFIIDTEVPEHILEKLIEKLQLLKPLDLKIEYLNQTQITDNNLPSNDFSSIDVRESLTEYVDKLENIEYKEDVIKYLLDILIRIEKEE